MDSADRPSHIQPAQRLRPRGSLDGNTRERAARAAALRARILELRRNSSDAAIGCAAGCVSARSSETNTQLSTAIDGADLNQSAKLSNTAPPGDRQALRQENAGKARWLEDSTAHATPAVRIDSQPQSQGRHPLRTAPSWLLSAIVHSMLLTACAIFTFSIPETPPGILIGSSLAEPEIVPDVSPPIVLRDSSRDDDHPLLVANQLEDVPLDFGAPPQLPIPDIAADMPSFSAFADSQGSSTTPQGGAGGGTASGRGAQFYGIQAQGDRFVFIVDSSTSMRFKFADALRELERAVRQLNQNQLFYVIFFDRDAERLKLGKWNRGHTRYTLKSRPESWFVPPTLENIEGLVHWMNTIQLEGDTRPHSAVLFALKKLHPDAIFLLSDGEFTDGGETESYLLSNNVGEDATQGSQPKTIVHCVGFYSREGEVTLKRIAAANGGTYRFVAPPWGSSP